MHTNHTIQMRHKSLLEPYFRYYYTTEVRAHVAPNQVKKCKECQVLFQKTYDTANLPAIKSLSLLTTGRQLTLTEKLVFKRLNGSIPREKCFPNGFLTLPHASYGTHAIALMYLAHLTAKSNCL